MSEVATTESTTCGIRDRVRELRRVRAGDLIPNPSNFRRHPENQRHVLGGVLREIGYADALLVREREDGKLELIDGHLRAETTPDMVVPVLVVDLTEAEAKRLLVHLDPLASMAQVDDTVLKELLGDIGKIEDSLAAELDATERWLEEVMREGGEEVEAPEAQIDRAEELQKEWKTEPGQLWVILGKAGEHRLLCGDSTKAEDVERVMGGKAAALMVTDPPYGVKLDQSWRDAALGDKAMGPGNPSTAVNDERADWSEAWELFSGDVAYVWHAGKYSDVVMNSLRSAGFVIVQQIIWNKSIMVMGRSDYHFKHEPCWYAVRRGKSHGWIGDRTQTTVIEAKSPKHIMAGSDEDKTPHPTQKPIECFGMIRNHAGNVFDPFLGSGTTMVAAEQLGRVCYGVEISPAYVAVALQRMKDMGLEPRLA